MAFWPDRLRIRRLDSPSAPSHELAPTLAEPHEWLPSHGLPPTYFPKSARYEWFNMDTFERYRENGGHPVYGEHDIQYCFNALGYRSPEFDELADLRVIAVGCSYTMGVGLPEDALFHARFARRLQAASGGKMVVWNLGSAGASNDYIARILHLAVPLLDPTVVLVNFTHAARREYASVQNLLMGYLPGWEPGDDLASQDIKRQFVALASDHDDRLNSFRNYRSVNALLSNRCWLFSASDPGVISCILDHVAKDRYAGVLENIDKARDHAHPGPGCHADLADRYWERFLALQAQGGTPESRVL